MLSAIEEVLHCEQEAVAKHEDLKVQWKLLVLSHQIEAAAIINQVGAITTKLKGFEELTLQPSMYIEVLEKEKKDVEHRCEYVRSVNAKLIEPTASMTHKRSDLKRNSGKCVHQKGLLRRVPMEV